MKAVPICVVRKMLMASSAVTPDSTGALCRSAQPSSLWYPSTKASNHLWLFSLVFFSTAAPMAGTSVRATTRLASSE